MRRRRAARSTSSAGWWASALRWVGGITATISLVLGAQQLSTWVGDALQRRREAAKQVDVARQQASRGDFAEAWKSLESAAGLQPGDQVESARVDIAFAWLQEGRPGPGRPFSVITDAVTPALDRALLNASGSRRADLLAHLGWATFLRLRDGARGDPAARYREALAIDPTNAYANAMLGHWMMWTDDGIDAARERFTAALSSAGEKRPFIRRLHIAALTNRGGDPADAELLRTADQMRRQGEPLEESAAERFYRLFAYRYGPRARPREDDTLSLTPADLQATYDWVTKVFPVDGRVTESNAIRERLKRLSEPSRTSR